VLNALPAKKIGREHDDSMPRAFGVSFCSTSGFPPLVVIASTDSALPKLMNFRRFEHAYVYALGHQVCAYMLEVLTIRRALPTDHCKNDGREPDDLRFMRASRNTDLHVTHRPKITVEFCK
jgi:hypothetical protein